MVNFVQFQRILFLLQQRCRGDTAENGPKNTAHNFTLQNYDFFLTLSTFSPIFSKIIRFTDCFHISFRQSPAYVLWNHAVHSSQRRKCLGLQPYTLHQILPAYSPSLYTHPLYFVFNEYSTDIKMSTRILINPTPLVPPLTFVKSIRHINP